MYLQPYISFWTRLVLEIRKPVIIAITGTPGKTTLTQMLGHVLMQEEARLYVSIVAKTAANENGNREVKMQLVRKSPYNWKRPSLYLSFPAHAIRQIFSSKYPRLFVIEFAGLAVPKLLKVARPRIAIVTNIGPAHLEEHKTVEDVYMKKREIVQAANGLVVLGAGHEFVSRLRADAKAPVVIVEGRGVSMAQEITRVVCRHLGLPEKVIEVGLNSYELPKGRLNRFKADDITVVDDSFNANPLSMKLALDTLAEERIGEGRRVAILGLMSELGEQNAEYHREIGLYARERAHVVIAVGEGAQHYSADQWFSTSIGCAEKVEFIVQPGDVVLIKGSHSAKMEHVVQRMKGYKVSA
jgi:UDP-N-acetylmuramoyl-tripeptide--D-alanyl-D-alanine ligase